MIFSPEKVIVSIVLRSAQKINSTRLDTRHAARRVLLTNCDALGYYADRYGFRIVSPLLPSTSPYPASALPPMAFPSQINAVQIPAIFLKKGTNSPLVNHIAQESRVKVVTELDLYSTRSMPVNAPTYLGMMEFTPQTICKRVEVMRGDTGQTRSGSGQARSGSGQTRNGSGQTHSGSGQTRRSAPTHPWHLCARPVVAHHASPALGIFIVIRPISWIVGNVFADSIKIRIIPDDVFVIITLPQPATKGRPSFLFDAANVFVCRHRLEPLHNLTHRRSS